MRGTGFGRLPAVLHRLAGRIHLKAKRASFGGLGARRLPRAVDGFACGGPPLRSCFRWRGWSVFLFSAGAVFRACKVGLLGRSAVAPHCENLLLRRPGTIKKKVQRRSESAFTTNTRGKSVSSSPRGPIALTSEWWKCASPAGPTTTPNLTVFPLIFLAVPHSRCRQARLFQATHRWLVVAVTFTRHWRHCTAKSARGLTDTASRDSSFSPFGARRDLAAAPRTTTMPMSGCFDRLAQPRGTLHPCTPCGCAFPPGACATRAPRKAVRGNVP